LKIAIPPTLLPTTLLNGSIGGQLSDGSGEPVDGVGDGRNLMELTVGVAPEAFNLFNRTNFDPPNNFVDDPAFDAILSAEPPRHIQAGLKLLF
jgi:hypothetical protein